MAFVRRLERLEHLTWRQAQAYFDGMPTDELLAWLDRHVGRPMREAMQAYLDACMPAELEELSRPPDPRSAAWQRWYAHLEELCAIYPYDPEEPL